MCVVNHKMTENEDNSSVIRLLAEQAEQRLIPEKSKEAYVKEYEKFSKWMITTNQTVIDETLMLAYMNQMSSHYKSSSMWCIHSKLQTMLRIKHGVDIASFHKLHAFMKSTNKGHEAKKSWVFTEEELRKFFVTAPDDTFLFLKVVAICGIFGSCRRQEMCDLRLSDIKEKGSILLITIRPCKTEKGRNFAVIDDSEIPYLQILKKYLSLRPDQVSTDRMFLKYSKGKCIRLVVGMNTFGQCPSLVATYLKLPDAKKYTGHAFRRTSATIMANIGMSVDELKRQVG
ncbi:uncharacterized protein LOC123009505 [Tribolium madens]|uniref:uncharacterized protein LOC123009505 n=1 Tax=Tribolium madens TaxID=41895 RepID=UPI001CF72C64|nr:uncharacterized protein LOC123009505 [Tribolium madens]